ncbi:alpha/beta hydrolase domain-containing protein VTE7-like [Rutidosis leptorrhynchoides]|uniref:alpha/beta hydrolase domain-containing protein VTE7-like n=1 Tax=Rutidosis leptorrhynchoides TaxID=125765 RepID=UPI003A9A0B82
MLKITTNITAAIPSMGIFPASNRKSCQFFGASTDVFPPFLIKEMEKIKDPFARNLISRIEMLPVELSVSKNRIMSSCVTPIVQDTANNPLVLLHGFDSSCLEWRYTLPLLEQAGLEAWALDILGWGFNKLETLPHCDVESKRDHLFQFWKSYIKRPMLLVGPSLGAAVAIDFAINHPEAVDKLILINASVYSEGTGNMSKLPKSVAFASVSLLKILPLRFYATNLSYNALPFNTCIDWTYITRLHCLLPWWKEATVDFMRSGGYNVSAQIKQVMNKTLIISGENDRIIDSRLAVRLHCELPNAVIRQISNCGHIPHVEKPHVVADLIKDFRCKSHNEVSFPLPSKTLHQTAVTSHAI